MERIIGMNHTIVTELSANIRGLARVALAGKWPTAVLTMLTATLLVAVPAGIIERMMEGQSASESFLLNLVTILIGGPVALGTCFFLIRLFRNQEISVAILFTGFDYFVSGAASVGDQHLDPALDLAFHCAWHHCRYSL